MQIEYEFPRGVRAVWARLWHPEYPQDYVLVYKNRMLNGKWKRARIDWPDHISGTPSAARLLGEVLIEAANLAEKWDADPASIPTPPKEESDNAL